MSGSGIWPCIGDRTVLYTVQLVHVQVLFQVPPAGHIVMDLSVVCPEPRKLEHPWAPKPYWVPLNL